MNVLQERILKEGKVLPGDIIKVDGFLNHRVDVKLMHEMARDFKNHFDLDGITAVVTIEASGIALATICADEFNVPMIFAKKAKSSNIDGAVYSSEIFSYTYNKKVTLIMSRDWLGPNDKVLIIDDFLANGEALSGLVDIVNQAGAQLIGMGVAVEKGFQPGGAKLRNMGIDLYSLAIIEKADENGIVFRN